MYRVTKADFSQHNIETLAEALVMVIDEPWFILTYGIEDDNGQD